MRLSEMMALLPTPDPAFKGAVTNDDNILAIDTSEDQDAAIGDYVVVRDMIAGIDPALNPTSASKTYLYDGTSDIKNNTQRTFKVTGDREAGSAFQDHVLDHGVIFGRGQTCVRNYVYFCALTGIGEKGKVSIIVNKDGGGAGGENAGIDVDLKKTGANPEKFDYAVAREG